MPTVLTVAIGRHRTRTVTLRRPGGLPATGFTAADTPTATLWAGDDQAPLASPAAAWVDPAIPRVRVTFAESDTATLPPATYRLLIDVLSQGRRIEVARAALRLVATPGTALALPTYCSLGEVEQLASGWVDELQDLDIDQAGFGEQRNLARRWLDRQVIARRRAWLDRWYRARAARDDWAAIESDLVTVQGYLDADGLMRDVVDGGMVELIAAHRTLAFICEPETGNQGETPYQRLAERHHAAANRLLVGWTARIDSDADGVADLILE